MKEDKFTPEIKTGDSTADRFIKLSLKYGGKGIGEILEMVDDQATSIEELTEENKRLREAIEKAIMCLGIQLNDISALEILKEALSGRIKRIEKGRNQVNPDCPECKGRGEIGFYFDIDTTQTVRCPKCFPEEKHVHDELNRKFRTGTNYI